MVREYRILLTLAITCLLQNMGHNAIKYISLYHDYHILAISLEKYIKRHIEDSIEAISIKAVITLTSFVFNTCEHTVELP